MRKINPPTYFLVFLILSAILHFIFPIERVIVSSLRYLGLAFVLIGIVMNIWADWLFKKNKTTILPGEKSKYLVEEGPFAISRNPMYLGMFFILFGEGVIFGSLSSILLPILFLVIIEERFIKKEEQMLIKKFGKKYALYLGRVRRWI